MKITLTIIEEFEQDMLRIIRDTDLWVYQIMANEPFATKKSRAAKAKWKETLDKYPSFFYDVEAEGMDLRDFIGKEVESMLKIVVFVDYCGGAEDEAQFATYYEVHNTEHYEYHPCFKDLDEAIAYIHSKGQEEIIIDDLWVCCVEDCDDPEVLRRTYPREWL